MSKEGVYIINERMINMGFYIGNLTSDWLPKFITAETLSKHTIYGVSFDGITHK